MTNDLEFIKLCRTFLLDCDGVLWRGPNIVNKSVEAVLALRQKKLQVAFVTNNSRLTRDQFCLKLQRFGFTPTIDECFCTSFLVATYLKSIELKGKVYVLGEPGLAEEIRLHGLDSYTIEDDSDLNNDQLRQYDLVGAVVVGLDTKFNYAKLSEACFCLKNPNCLFLATNTDAALPSTHGRNLPGAGTMVAAVKAGSLRKPITVGKPSPKMFDLIKKNIVIDPEKTCMVGDRIETDIKFGNDCGMKTVLVLSGITTLNDYTSIEKIHKENPQSIKNAYSKPNYICDTLFDLVSEL